MILWRCQNYSILNKKERSIYIQEKNICVYIICTKVQNENYMLTLSHTIQETGCSLHLSAGHRRQQGWQGVQLQLLMQSAYSSQEKIMHLDIISLDSLHAGLIFHVTKNTGSSQSTSQPQYDAMVACYCTGEWLDPLTQNSFNN